METVQDVLKQAQWLISKGRANEQAKLLLPRIAAKRRVANKEKRTRVQFECTPEQYSAFHGELKRIRETAGNITVAMDIVNDWLGKLKEETIRALAEETKPW